MDRTITIPLAVPIPHGHRVEVVESSGAHGDSATAVVDLETGIRYENALPATADVIPDNRAAADLAAGRTVPPEPARASWIGTVLACTVTARPGGATTTLVVDPVEPAAGGAAEADVALRGADAAAEAARAEAVRWGGVDRPPQPEPVRIW